MEIDLLTAARALEGGYFNLLRRVGDGLLLSADRWRMEALTEETVRFVAQAPEAEPLLLPVADVERTTWDRLPRQQVRSQVRFYLRNGDVWTFSGTVDESRMPS